MKQVKNLIIFVIVICVIILFSASFNKALYDRHYALSGEIWELDYNNDIVTVRDFSGHLWTFSGCEDWMLGDICNMIMDNHNTDNIYDDQIKKVTYGGSLE